MCWKINKKLFDKYPEKYHRIADKDITVYKFGKVIEKIFYPFFQDNFYYKPNVLNDKIKLALIINREYGYSIYEGYHSYTNEEKADRCLCIFKDLGELKDTNIYCKAIKYVVGKFIIPQGSEYYENESEAIVSSQLVWAGEISIKNN